MVLQKAMDLIPGAQAEKTTDLSLREPVRPISFQGQTLQRFARKVRPPRFQLMGNVFWKVDGNLHKGLLLLFCPYIYFMC